MGASSILAQFMRDFVVDNVLLWHVFPINLVSSFSFSWIAVQSLWALVFFSFLVYLQSIELLVRVSSLSKDIFFLLCLYSPILCLCRLHETFRFISVTRSRTVGRTPWTGDQLVARPLLTAPGNCDDGEVGRMDGFGRGNRSTRRKADPTPLCPPQIPLVRPGREPGTPQWEASD
jgi:hypothetical protein